MVPPFASHSNSPAPLRPNWLTSHDLDRCFDATIEDRTENFDRALRFDLNAPCEHAHILLTALARVAQWTGVYTCILDALARDGDLTILTGMLPVVHDLAVRMSVTPKIHNFFCQAPAHARPRIERAQLSSARTYVCVSIAQSPKCTSPPPSAAAGF